MVLVTRTSYLTVNSIDLSTPAYWITNLDSEMLRGPTLRGGDTVIPAATGVYPNKRIVTAKLLQFHMVIRGDVDNTGAATGDYRAGLTTNVEILTAGLGLGYAVGDGTVAATWHRWDGSPKTASVHVVSFETDDLLHRHASAVLELSVPSGAFA
jgi:hypothetical protein